MPDQTLAEQIHTKVFEWLKNTAYSASSLEPLTGGQANFIYRARLLKPLEDGTTEVIIKHGEPYMARHPGNAIAITRCGVEAQCLRELSTVELRSHQIGTASFIIRVPNLYLYDEATNTQIQEYLPRGLSLKEYALKHFPSPTPDSLRPHVYQLGKLLAEYIATVNRKAKDEYRDWTLDKAGRPEPKLFATLKGNQRMQQLKHFINYDWIIERVNQFPELLSKYSDTFIQVKQQALRELERAPEDLDILHGDWATVNVLLSDKPIQVDEETHVLAVDWETAQLGVTSGDHGEMLGEMYALWFYRRIDAGLWLFQGYIEGLQVKSEALAWRIALQTGVHLLAFGTMALSWGTREEIEELARLSGDIISKAWVKDRDWFDQSDLKCLFGNITVG